jgi:hypothetical protein
MAVVKSLRGWLNEVSGACGDLGTFIPHVIGAIAVTGLAPAGVLFGFAVFWGDQSMRIYARMLSS